MNSLFRNRVFLIVAAADLLQQAGIWIRNMALLYYIMDETNNNPTAVSLLTVFEYLPIFIFSLLGGAMADRWNPKRTVIAGDALSAVSILIILGLVMAGWWQAAFAATIVSAVVSQFSQPSSAVLFKRHVPSEYIGTAIGITQSLMALFLIAGPVVGTMVYTQLGIQASLAVLIGIFLTAALIQLALPSTPRSPVEPGSSIWKEVRAGIHYVRRKPNLRTVSLMFLTLGFAIGITQPLDVFVIMERLSLPKEAVQWFGAAAGAGVLIGGGIAAATASRIERLGHKIIPATFVWMSIATIIEVISLWPLVTGSVRLLLGIALSFFQVVFGAMMIREVNEEFIGRVNGVVMPLMTAGIVLGAGVAGMLVRSVTLFGAYGASALLILLCAWISRRLQAASEANLVAKMDQARMEQ
ncbi:MFS transporter [Paenibacillus fonticola]|uniref:MFS transporter n=1 Tax=Paenibacillus fonticola TaxID=379896 RepID=UPI000372E77E|nr:MFS transporter [Paenibacillus fonticola]